MTRHAPTKPASTTSAIPGIPGDAAARLLETLRSCPRVTGVWRERPGSDIDLCLDGAELSHCDRLRLMAAIDALLLPWTIDLALRSELPSDLAGHVSRVGRCLWLR